MIRVVLSAVECAMSDAGAQFFTDRVFREKLRAGHGEQDRSYGERLTHGVRGGLGEMALAKALGVYYDPQLNEFGRDGRDVGGFQVRATGHAAGHLIIFEPDKDERTAVLVVVTRFDDRAECDLMGQRLVSLCKLPRFEEIARAHVRAGSPRQWWVPQSFLDPLKL